MRKRLLGLLFTVLMVFCLAPSAALAAAGTSSSGIAAAIADGTSSIADPDTIWDWEGLIEGKTANVGRIWTDKSVTTDSMTNNNITVKKADGSVFLTALTALSSTSNLSSTATTPLDIVLVLDTSSSMTQNISTSTGTTTRIQALKDAANSFVDVIAGKNEDISDEAKQHRVAVVSFNSSATTNQDMTACAGDKATGIKSAISALTTGQGTHSDYGLQQAQAVLTGSKRDGAKQVVVFFTDGIPTVSGADNFDPAIASPAVTAAGQMKDAGNGATVYTIGIHNEANPSDDPEADRTHVLNKFLHAVSSNYLAATYTASGSTYAWSFGDRAKKSDGTTDADFYKSATSADKLKEIFEDISQEITKNAGYPTHTTDGYESTSGYITFNDQLGDYMEVTDLSTLIYDAEKYTFESKTTEGNVDTYHFSGKVNSGIGEGNLSDIIVTVTRSESVAAGDKVEVKIPATLIPLRHFEVDEDAGTMTVTDKTPITVFYSSALKSEVADLLVNPDDDMAAYIAKNTDKTTGKVNFYANKWNGGTLGDVTSQFDPSSGNSYYYITQDTPIFKDEDCTTRASQIVDGETYYYQHAYYALVDGGPKAKKMTETLTFPGSAAAAFEGCIGQDDDGCYFKAGTARLVYINQLHKEKKDEQGNSTNYTGTATDVLNPKWNSETSVAAATTVTPHLGNNGKLSVAKPATLKVSKAIAVPDGYNAEDYANAEFTFELNVPKAAGYSFPAVVLDANGQATCDEFNLTFDASGKATHTIKPDETLQVSGLGAGWTYTITETKMPVGFTQTVPADKDGKAIAATGTFVAGQTATASFTNTYSAEPVAYNAVTDLGVYKQLIGRDWTEDDAFAFELKALTDGAPMPQGAQGGVATVTVTKDDVVAENGHASVSFGGIAYTKVGTYKYQVKEANAGQTIAGVTYADNAATFAVTVTDLDEDGNHTGRLVAKATLDSGAVAFENTYEPTNASYDTADAGLNKVLIGRDWLTSDAFSFTIEAKTSGAPLPQDAQGNVVTKVAVTKDNAANFGFGTITFTQDMIADAPNRTKVFEYAVTEVVPADADKIPGVSYDTHAATIEVTVTDNLEGKLVATAELVSAPGTATFTNEYTTTNATFDTAEFLLAKELTGREWKDGDSFQFKLEAVTEGAPMPESDVATATQAGSFDFGTITYEAAGEYEYEVTEVPGTAGGVTYDTNVAKFKVTVTDNLEGELIATAELVSAPGTATFTNEYKPQPVTATANFEKVISGRDWVDGDSFTFDLTAVDGAPMPEPTSVTVTNADAVGGRAPFSFGPMTYTAIGTYKYQVTEAAGRLAGITYDDHVATITVTVTDDGEGKLVAATTVTGSVFTNTYGTTMSYTAAGSLSVAKTLTGRAMVGGQFKITVTPDDQASADALGIDLTGHTVSMPAAADGAQATVDVLAGHDVNFSQANAGKTYAYKVVESYTAANGYTYDTAVRAVTIAVTDDPATATLTATTTVTGGPEGTQVFTYKGSTASGKKAVVPFYNSYFASTDVPGGTAAQVSATKSLTGRDMAVGEFTFGVHLAGSDRDVLTATNAADGSVTLGTLHYDTKSLAQLVADGYATRNGDDWTVPYVAYEKTDGLADKGITAMTQPIAFTVTVHDNGDGTLTATANIPDAGLAFANAYATGDPAQVSVTGVKVLEHADGLTPNDITGKFTFTIGSDDPAAPLPTSVTATNDANGNVDFGTIGFTLDDLNRALGTADEKKDEAQVEDEKKDDAEIKDEAKDDVEKTEEKPEEKSEEKSDSEAEDETQAKDDVVKTDEPAVDVMSLDEEEPVAEVNEPQVAEPVAETVTEPVSDPVAEPVSDPEPLVLLSTPVVSDAPVSNDDAQATNDTEVNPVTEGALETQPAKFFRTLSLFKTATFSATKRASETVPAANEAAPAARSYTFVYTVTETGSVAGVTNDAQVKTVRIKVTDDGLGNLTAELVGEKGEPAFTFTNSYDVTPVDSSVTDQIDVTKRMTGRDLTGGEFTFELLEGDEVVARGSNGPDGSVSMAPVTYSEPGAHRYTLREVGGGNTEAGVTYDGTTYQVDTVVTDNGDGTLAVTHRVADGQDVVFANSYEAKPTSVVIGAAKVLKGKDLQDGQFTFKLVGEGIELTAKNAADGSVVFGALEFAAPGTYEYDVYEVNDGQANVTYDEAKRHVVVTVTDDGEGHLVAEVAGDDAEALTFTNTYDEPVVPTPDPEPTPEPTPTVVEKQTVVTKTVRKNVYVPYTGDQVTWTAAALLGACALVFVAVALALKRTRK